MTNLSPRSSSKAEPRPRVLPGEQSIDEHLLEEAVLDLNQIFALKAIETARLIGKYILDHFFDGSLANFHDRGKKHLSFRCLAERSDLRFSYSYLWTCVAVVEQFEHLPRPIAESLPLSHHRLLLPVRNPEEKIKLATRAVEEGLSKRELAEAIKSRPPRRRQRRAVANAGEHPLARTLAQIRAAVTEALSSPALTQLTELPPAASGDVIVELEREVGKLSQLLEALKRRQGRRA